MFQKNLIQSDPFDDINEFNNGENIIEIHIKENNGTELYQENEIEIGNLNHNIIENNIGVVSILFGFEK